MNELKDDDITAIKEIATAVAIAGGVALFIGSVLWVLHLSAQSL